MGTASENTSARKNMGRKNAKKAKRRLGRKVAVVKQLHVAENSQAFRGGDFFKNSSRKKLLLFFSPPDSVGGTGLFSVCAAGKLHARAGKWQTKFSIELVENLRRNFFFPQNGCVLGLRELVAFNTNA